MKEIPPHSPFPPICEWAMKAFNAVGDIYGPACLSGDSGPLPFGVPFAEPYASNLPPLLPYGAGGPGVCLGVRSRSRVTPVHVPRPPVLAEARDRTIPTG